MKNLAVRQRQAIEKRIARRVIAGMLAAGFSISVNDGEETTLRRSLDPAAILAAMFSTDEEWLIIHKADQPRGLVDVDVDDDTRKAFGWVRFIYGNDGWDVVNDYTTNLEPVMAPINELADAIDRGTAPDELPDDVAALLAEIVAQDEFTGATPDNLPLWQAYNILNAWRAKAAAILGPR